MIALSVDPPEISRRVVERAELPFPILSDESGAVLGRLGLIHEHGGPDGSDIALPAHLLIDTDRHLRWTYVSDRIQNRLSPDEVVREVRAALGRTTL